MIVFTNRFFILYAILLVVFFESAAEAKSLSYERWSTEFTFKKKEGGKESAALYLARIYCRKNNNCSFRVLEMNICFDGVMLMKQEEFSTDDRDLIIKKTAADFFSITVDYGAFKANYILQIECSKVYNSYCPSAEVKQFKGSLTKNSFIDQSLVTLEYNLFKPANRAVKLSCDKFLIH